MPHDTAASGSVSASLFESAVPTASVETDAEDAESPTEQTTLRPYCGTSLVAIPQDFDVEAWQAGDVPHPFDWAIRDRITTVLTAGKVTSGRRLHLLAEECDCAESRARQRETWQVTLTNDATDDRPTWTDDESADEDEDGPTAACEVSPTRGWMDKPPGVFPPGYDPWCSKCVRRVLPAEYQPALAALRTARRGDQTDLELLRAPEGRR
ncbi:hypothetical protein [Halomarina oriensis]|uniref:Uncharacterized protein n=1 Tax=Halomarina oriensis TaxID=671145 RepID=A0A6B0GR17_9EURY|nr:hypothetical protein [Halomarina oriensis]MWG36531.1 hypothetical protein [Halomarina oriensis]